MICKIYILLPGCYWLHCWLNNQRQCHYCMCLHALQHNGLKGFQIALLQHSKLMIWLLGQNNAHSIIWFSKKQNALKQGAEWFTKWFVHAGQLEMKRLCIFYPFFNTCYILLLEAFCKNLITLRMHTLQGQFKLKFVPVLSLSV